MKEAHKSLRRRYCESAEGVFPWRDIFEGAVTGLDIGCEPDEKLPLDNFEGFNLSHGDANRLSEILDRTSRSFDVIHGSHILQFMEDPTAALRDWFTLLKPGGYMIQTVPDWGAYERMRWPSPHNPSHRSTWSMFYRGNLVPNVPHIFVPEFVETFSDIAEVKLARYVERNFDWGKEPGIDQTLAEAGQCEVWVEMVFQKRDETIT